ncbi:MAG: substrate-binding domain-containing protein, partial [Nitratireductor sp.]|nr:substrate-binding domain-containing protein [Nitratireductor sp.]
EGGVTSVENLLAKEPNMNVVYTINEPAAEGAYQALKKAGKEKGVLIVSVDGGCPGVKSVRDGVIGATSQQYPLLMASKGIEAIVAFAKDGTKPSASEGLSFFNTGVNLVTDQPVEGVPSIDSAKGLELCWG